MIYDAAIIGTGPAGLSAALTLKANSKHSFGLAAGVSATRWLKQKKFPITPDSPMCPEKN